MTEDDIQRELQALAACVEALEPLKPATRIRILRYLTDRFPAPLLSGTIPIPRRRASKPPPETT